MTTLTEAEQENLDNGIKEYIVFYANRVMDGEQFRERVNTRIRFLAKRGFKVSGVGYDFEVFCVFFHNESTGYTIRAVRVGGQYGDWQYTGAYTPKDADLLGTYEWFTANTPRELFAQMED